MQGVMIRRVALDFIKGVPGTGVVNVAFVIHVASMHFNDFPPHPSGPSACEITRFSIEI
jgi:hypothetical protein